MKDPEHLLPPPFQSHQSLLWGDRDVMFEYYRNTFLGALSCFQLFGSALTLQQIRQVEFCPNRQGILCCHQLYTAYNVQ